jgi:hypothetical protein
MHLMLRRSIPLLILIVATSPVPGAGAAPTPLCAFDEGTGSVHVHLPVQDTNPAVPVVLVRAGDAIVVDGEPCGAATVTNTDSILVDGEDQPGDWGHIFEIDLSGGPFAPGMTDEGDGSSEIEMRVDPGPSVNDDVTMRGGDEPDVMLLHGTAVNLDGAPDDVPDLRLIDMHDWATEDSSLVNYDTLHVVSGGGADRLHLEARGPNAPFAVYGSGGPGPDRIVAWSWRAFGDLGDDHMRNIHGAELFGGPGDDRLSARHAAFSNSYGGGGDDLLIGGPGPDGPAGGPGHDVMVGFGGPDFMNGNGGADELDGGGGSDTLYGDDGGDSLRGGGDRDKLYGGLGRNRCDDDPSDLVVRDCDGRLLLG